MTAAPGRRPPAIRRVGRVGRVGRVVAVLVGVLALALAIGGVATFLQNRSRPASAPAPCAQTIARLPVATNEDAVRNAAFSADGATIATPGQPIQLWDTATGQPTKTFTLKYYGIDTMVFSPDGRTLAVSGSSGIGDFLGDSDVALEQQRSGWSVPVVLWNTATGGPGNILFAREPVTSIAFSPDSATIATGTVIDGAVMLRNVGATGDPTTLNGHTSGVLSMAFSPDGGRLVTGSRDGTARLWDVASGTVIRTFDEHWKQVSVVAFSPDGTMLATAGSDRSVWLWDVATGQRIARMRSAYDILRVMFSADGQTIVGVDGTGVIQRWNTTTGTRLDTLRACVRGAVLDIAPGATALAAGGVVAGGEARDRTSVFVLALP